MSDKLPEGTDQARKMKKEKCSLCKGKGKITVNERAILCGCAVTKRPWKLGVQDRGLGRYSYAALDADGTVIVELGDHQLNALMVIAAVNAFTGPVDHEGLNKIVCGG